jgi:hypothetical protein
MPRGEQHAQGKQHAQKGTACPGRAACQGGAAYLGGSSLFLSFSSKMTPHIIKKRVSDAPKSTFFRLYVELFFHLKPETKFSSIPYKDAM